MNRSDDISEYSTTKRALSAFFGAEILNHYGTQKGFKKGTVVFREGDKGDYLFVVKSGSFHVYKGKDPQRSVAKLKEGHIVGEMAVITGKPRSATVEAIEDSVVYLIGRENLYRIFQDYPQVREIIGVESIKREEENIMMMLEDEEEEE